MKQNLKSREEIMERISAFRMSRILLSACELDIFSLIDSRAMPAREVAQASKIDYRAAKILLDALTAMGFIEKKNNRYSNTESSSKFLVRRSPNYIRGLAHQSHLWNSWSMMTDVLRSGRPAQTSSINEREKEWLESFISAMDDRGGQQAKEVLDLIDLSGVSRLLDVGGGSGIFAATFTEAKSDISAVIFDLPNVIPITARFLAQHPAGDRIETMAGDYLKDDIGGDYDMIFMSAIVHSNSLDENTKLIKKCSRALTPGGRICILDFIMNDVHTHPEPGALFAVNMLVNTPAGRSYSFREISIWLKEAGLDRIDLKPMSRGLGLVTGGR